MDQPTLHFAWRQTHLSSLDLGDRRTGAGRTRGNIQAFFNNGARTAAGSAPGGNLAGTADDVLVATGETLAQIQDRVLGAGVNTSVPLFPRSRLRRRSASGPVSLQARSRSSSTQRT